MRGDIEVIADECAVAAEEEGAPSVVRGLATTIEHVSDLVATCAAQQEDILCMDTLVRKQIQIIDELLDRVRRLEQQLATATPVGPSNLTDRVNVLEIDVETLKDGTLATNQRIDQQICAAAASPTTTTPETIPKFDGLPIFCDATKTNPNLWWRQFELKLDIHHVINPNRHAYLYSRSGGVCQAWLDNMLSTHNVTVSELHTKISWADLKATWHKQLQVELPELQEAEKLQRFYQNDLPSTDWITEYQRLASTPNLPLTFVAIKHLLHQEELPGVAERLDASCGDAYHNALLDSGATRNFISQSFIQRAGLGAQVRRKPNPTAIKLADGRTQQLLDRYIEVVPVYFAPHACEPVTFDVLDTDFDIILGMPWLASADHTVNFHQRTLTVRDAFSAEVPCTIPLPHSSIRCQVVTAKSFRVTCAYERTDEIGLCFLRAAATTESSPTDLSSDPRVVRLLDEFTDIFESPTSVVPDRPISHEIILEAGAVPPKGCIYRMSEEELAVLRAQLDDLLDKGWIRPSSSPYAAMTNEFRAMLDRFVLVYLDDILVYSRTLEDHLEHLRRVLETLRRAKYKANRDKCEFIRQELEYLGHFVTPEGISPLPNKIQAIQEWPEPKTVTNVRSFLGLAGYYQRFIKGYSTIAAPLSKLQCEDRPFDFDDNARTSFLALKAALLSAEVLRIYDLLLPTGVTTDAYGYGIGAVLEQHDGVDKHPIEYFSKKVPAVHLIDDARKKELLAFVHALKRWLHFLLGRRQF
ncbi:hypothetical protein CBR_g44908 [Chara braunii]|uniref:Reverse transcriptase domain-containing protein n=1 Tax=Chara braunii TaxID=69332 RepID=A0A388LY40_CHABU|nr:hypothetical protein CBR_g44908 [Chara braunii]|eukprot:GBG87173.1 hypothetical protein CBR_g44908 [Chara braunii]